MLERAHLAVGRTVRRQRIETAQHFQDAWKALGISYDKFIRTTDQRHELAVQELFRRLWDARSPKTGEPVLFEEDYEGLYCESCEAFKQEKDLDEQGRCPIHKKIPRKIRESNFFFRLSEYDEALLRHIDAHPEFIQPDARRSEVLGRIKLATLRALKGAGMFELVADSRWRQQRLLILNKLQRGEDFAMTAGLNKAHIRIMFVEDVLSFQVNFPLPQPQAQIPGDDDVTPDRDGQTIT